MPPTHCLAGHPHGHTGGDADGGVDAGAWLFSLQHPWIPSASLTSDIGNGILIGAMLIDKRRVPSIELLAIGSGAK